MSLLGKWNSRFAFESESLWRCIIGGKFGKEVGDQCSSNAREGHGIGL